MRYKGSGGEEGERVKRGKRKWGENKGRRRNKEGKKG